jgi:tetratricopeptide (TPR) repeat protein
MSKQPRGFIVFRFADDAERYGDSDSESDRKAVRAIFDAGDAAYVTEIAEFDMETFDGKPYVKIENSDSWPNPWFMPSSIAERMRWRCLPEAEYGAREWMEAAFTAWAKDDLTEVERLLGGAAVARDATTAQISESLLLRAAILQELDRETEAASLLDEVELRFAKSQDTATRGYAAEARVDKGEMIAARGDREDAIRIFDDVIERYGGDQAPVVRIEVARAIMSKGVQLCEVGRFDEAVIVNDSLIAKFHDAVAPEIQEQVAIGMRNKAAALQRLGRLETALETCDALIAFGELVGTQVTSQVAWAFYSKAETLKRLGRGEKAKEALREIVSRFDGDKDEHVQRLVTNARRQLA